jgi:exosortase/archaeosortase family protein
VQMDTSARLTDAHKFILWGVGASLAIFGGLRLPWTEAHVVLPLTLAQGGLAMRVFGAPTLPVAVTLACSGADAVALCAGAVLAYPVRWRARLSGLAGGIVLILVLNTLRIGTLGAAAASPVWFEALHVFVWPALLVLTIAGYVFGWMRIADAWPRAPRPASAPSLPPSAPRRAWQPSPRFGVLTATFLIVFVAASPFYLESPLVLALGGLIARTAALVLTTIGIGAQAEGHVLATARGAFIVTQECIFTPLIPVYAAAVCAHATTWRRMSAGILAALPLFTALGIARLLVVAVPDGVASPTFLVHAFYQLLLGAVIVFLAAMWRHGGKAAPAYAAAGVTVGVLFVVLMGGAYTALVTPRGTAAPDDPQGAVAFLPAFQVGFYLALWVATFLAARWTRFAAGLVILVLSQVAGLFALHVLAVAGLAAHVRDVRAYAVAVPVVIFAAVVSSARAAR